MNVTVNGVTKKFDKEVKVLDLLTEFKIDTKMVVIEVNEKILPKNKYETTVLQPNDMAEIVSFVGGGWKIMF